MAEGLSPGEVVSRYRIEDLLGKGGMGSVYRATVISTGERVAIKTMHPEVAAHPDFRKRFLREARAAMAADHPNIVRVLEVFEHAGTPMLAMEMLSGQSLEALVRSVRRLSLEQTAQIMLQVTSAVGKAHAMGIVHRDLKPDNIFISHPPGAAVHVKVLDFGIAKLTATSGAAAETQALTQTGAMMGTPLYMSPEQAAGEKNVDYRSDIWSLGVILYQCLSGVLPTDAPSFGELFRLIHTANFKPLSQLVPELPAEVSAIVGRMLKPQREERLADLRELFAVLGNFGSVSAPSFGPANIIAEREGINTPSRAPAVPSAPPANVRPLSLTPTGLRFSPGANPHADTVAMAGAPARPDAAVESSRAPRNLGAATTTGALAQTVAPVVPMSKTPVIVASILVLIALAAVGWFLMTRA